jgi:hypothetical protein
MTLTKRAADWLDYYRAYYPERISAWLKAAEESARKQGHSEISIPHLEAAFVQSGGVLVVGGES